MSIEEFESDLFDVMGNTHDERWKCAEGIAGSIIHRFPSNATAMRVAKARILHDFERMVDEQMFVLPKVYAMRSKTKAKKKK